jgi:hypothetical protein
MMLLGDDVSLGPRNKFASPNTVSQAMHCNEYNKNNLFSPFPAESRLHMAGMKLNFENL